MILNYFWWLCARFRNRLSYPKPLGGAISYSGYGLFVFHFVCFIKLSDAELYQMSKVSPASSEMSWIYSTGQLEASNLGLSREGRPHHQICIGGAELQ